MGEIQLPSHWKVVKLNDISQEIQSGGTPYRKKSEFYGGSISWIKTLDLNENIVIDSEEKITEAGFKSIRGKIRPINTVMVAMYGGKGTVGKSGILGITATTNQAVCCIEPNPNNFDSFYLLYYLIYFRPIWMRYAIGTRKDPNISKGIIEKTEIPLPPLPEQKTIAHTLRTIQKAKETRQQELELERERKAALMQYLFTFGTSSSHNKVELQETKIGYIPKFWQINQCDHVCEKISVGVVVKPASHYVEKGVPAFRSLNIREDRLSTHNLVFFSEEANDTILTKSKLKTGDVLIVRTGYPGTSCVVPPEFEGANCIDIVFARPKREVVTSEYLSRYFNSPEGKRQALTAKTGLAQQHLNVNAVQRCLIPIPPLHEQKQITDVLIACDRKIQALEKEIALTDELFHAMLEQLMIGKISTQPLTETYV